MLLTYWVVSTIQKFGKLSFYFEVSSLKGFFEETAKFLWIHIPIVIFLVLVVLCRLLLKAAMKNLTINEILIKSVKPADHNYSAILISYSLPLFKLCFSDSKDQLFTIGLILVILVYSSIAKSSYHFNLLIRLFGYRNYEIQTKAEITYLMLSKAKIINANHVSECITLTDHMLINVSKP